MPASHRADKLLTLLPLLGFALRCMYAFGLPTASVFTAGGGDSAWYLANGYGFFSGQLHGWVNGIAFYNSGMPSPPLYILFAGVFQSALPQHETIVIMRLLQCLAGAATIWLTARIAMTITDDHRAAILAAALAAFHPALVMESANITTETLYIFFVALGLWLYIDQFAAAQLNGQAGVVSHRNALILAALALGLATLTRAASALFPLVLAAHLLWLGRRRLVTDWRRACLTLLLVYGALVSTWTLHNLVLYDRLVIVSDQLLGALWRGAEANDGSPQENDALLLDGEDAPIPEGCLVDCGYRHPAELYLRKIGEIVGGDPAGFVWRRVSELGYAVLQPHGTVELGGTSVWGAARGWLADDRRPGAMLDVLRAEGFASKLLVWAFHYVALAFGGLGIWLLRARWQLTLPLAGFALYTLAAHLVLHAEPRYIFPIEFALIVFASAALIQLYDRRASRTRGE